MVYSDVTVVCMIQRGDGAAGVFSCLTGQLTTEACEHAIAHGDYKMALLISQAFGSENIRHMMLKQLAAWSDTQVLVLLLLLWYGLVLRCHTLV